MDKNEEWILVEQKIGKCGEHFKELLSWKENQSEEAQEQGNIEREKGTEADQPGNKQIEEQPRELEELRIIM